MRRPSCSVQVKSNGAIEQGGSPPSNDAATLTDRSDWGQSRMADGTVDPLPSRTSRPRKSLKRKSEEKKCRVISSKEQQGEWKVWDCQQELEEVMGSLEERKT
mmetsp:Transcript_16747/g.34511  ORF Transcript_16747/g.34511 Transcript_16747/m.34511 type:complete len:103 (+) Transcript_16747:364-672(+)